VTALTNKYMVWISENSGEFVIADEIFVGTDTVSFLISGTIVKSYPTKEYIKYNKVENLN